MKRLFAVAFLFATLSGCMATMTPNYKIGEPMQAYVGDVMTSVNGLAGLNNYSFELLYGGTSKGTIKIMYRESVDGMARPAFNQELTYDASEKTIQFKRLKLWVTEANNNHISFMVLEDKNSIKGEKDDLE